MGRPSTATVISLVALFFALGTGGGYAASVLIGSAQIKDHSIRLVDLSPAVIDQLNKPATVDPSRISSLISVPPVMVDPNTVGTATAMCPAGSVAISGGGSGNIAGLAASRSVEKPGTSYPVGWFVVVANQTPVTVPVTAEVVCLAP